MTEGLNTLILTKSDETQIGILLGTIKPSNPKHWGLALSFTSNEGI